MKFRRVNEAKGAHLEGTYVEVAAEFVEGMRSLGERGEAVRNEGQEGAERRVRGQKERSWVKRKRTQFGNVYA